MCARAHVFGEQSVIALYLKTRPSPLRGPLYALCLIMHFLGPLGEDYFASGYARCRATTAAFTYGPEMSRCFGTGKKRRPKNLSLVSCVISSARRIGT